MNFYAKTDKNRHDMAVGGLFIDYTRIRITKKGVILWGQHCRRSWPTWWSSSAGRVCDGSTEERGSAVASAAGGGSRSEKCDSHAYNRAIKYAQRKARKTGVKIPDWFLYQLCHASVTATSLEYGWETALLVAGHKSQKTTAIYEHKAETISVRVAGNRKKWCEEN